MKSWDQQNQLEHNKGFVISELFPLYYISKLLSVSEFVVFVSFDNK